jgi:hypothetical protein
MHSLGARPFRQRLEDFLRPLFANAFWLGLCILDLTYKIGGGGKARRSAKTDGGGRSGVLLLRVE